MLETGLTQAKSAERRKRWRRIGAVASGVLFIVALVLLVRIVRELDVAKVKAAFAATSRQQLLMAFALTVCSYLLLTCYDALALRQIGKHVRYGVAALASFTSYAVSFTLGFPLITAATVRFWIYEPTGLTAAEIASLTIIAGITFWLGMGLVLGFGLLSQAYALSDVNHLAISVNQMIGLGLLAAVVCYLVWVSIKPRAIQVQQWRLHLPSLRVSLGQILLGAVDVCCAGSVLFVLLPAGNHVAFETFIAVYVFACILGIASHAPAGIGVFEATVLLALPGESREALLGSLLMYRVCYYLVPFVLALALLGLREIHTRWRAMQVAGNSSR